MEEGLEKTSDTWGEIQQHGHERVLAMEVCVSGSQQVNDHHSDNVTEENVAEGPLTNLRAELRKLKRGPKAPSGSGRLSHRLKDGDTRPRREPSCRTGWPSRTLSETRGWGRKRAPPLPPAFGSLTDASHWPNPTRSLFR